MALRHEDARSKPGPAAAPDRRQLLTSAAAGLVIGAGVVAPGAVIAPTPAKAGTGDSMVTILPSGDSSGATDAAAINGALSAGQAVQLVPGTYYVNATISMPGHSILRR